VADKNIYDKKSRVNTFAHVNYSKENPNVGVLLCINGTGIQYSWLKHNMFDNKYSYVEMNNMAGEIEPGSRGVLCYPFGNGAERVFENKDVQAQFKGINFNIHGKGDIIHAAQEGIAFSFKYGFDIMKNIGMNIKIIKAGNSNLFQSRIFKEVFVNTCNVELEIYNTDGSQGAARGAGIGAGIYTPVTAYNGLTLIEKLSPDDKLSAAYKDAYGYWLENLRMD
jgi:xylulokinase